MGAQTLSWSLVGIAGVFWHKHALIESQDTPEFEHVFLYFLNLAVRFHAHTPVGRNAPDPNVDKIIDRMLYMA